MAAVAFQLPANEEDLQALLETLSDDDLRQIYEIERELSHRLAVEGPQNDDELHAWIFAELKVNVPRTAVCEDHDAPFTFIADVFFERVDAALLMANRGGGKTFMVAIIHWCNSRFKPGCESLTFAAVESQSFRCYNHLKNWIYDDNGEKRPEVVGSQMRDTRFRNGSVVGVLGSTPEQVNGPHPHKAHADEIELMREDTWKESRNMTVSGITRDGRVILPQDILTSTRKGPSGRMQQLIDEIEEAEREGYEPPRTFYKYCIKETAAERPDCRSVDPVLREARLKELGRDPCELCNCDRIRKGSWGKDESFREGSPRTLDQICAGDFFRSRGWQPPSEINKQFRENDKDTFEVQQLCSKPEMKYHFFPGFREAHYGIRNYVPDPRNGPSFTSTDWGGTNSHSVHWYQLLNFEIEAEGWTMYPDGRYPVVRLKEGTIVCFAEVYIAEIGNEALANLVKDKEARIRKAVEETYGEEAGLWRVKERFADPQGKSARQDWKAWGLPCTWHCTREFEEHIKTLRSIAQDDDLFRVDARCEKFIWEVKGWRRDETTLKEIEEHNHAMSDFRYAMQNIKVIKRKYRRSQQAPASADSRHRAPQVRVTLTNRNRGPVGYRDRDQFAEWRKGLGEPVTRRRF